jgi:TolA-binding protein
MADSNDSALFETIGEFMKGHFDIEDVKNDPELPATNRAVQKMIFDYNENRSGRKENETFIRENFSGSAPDVALNDEIQFIKQEINDNKLNDITAEWVKEWHSKKQKIGSPDPKTKEIRDFITGAIGSIDEERVKPMHDTRAERSRNGLFVRYVSLAAAAMIGTIIFIKTLIPASNPEKLFYSYYRPFDAISPVTRSLNSNEDDNYSTAIASYKSGDYKSAAAGFSTESLTYPNLSSPKFYLGLSELALEEYDKAISLLAVVAFNSGEYAKEATWYLGLSYLRSDNKVKATECFRILAGSDGFYKTRAEKILRRIK